MKAAAQATRLRHGDKRRKVERERAEQRARKLRFEQRIREYMAKAHKPIVIHAGRRT